MKQTAQLKQRVLVTTIIFLLVANSAFAETEADVSDKTEKPFFTFNYGATASWLTRIIKQTGRSNFVFEDFLPGLYVNTELQNSPFLTPAVRLAAYYPLTSAFNEVPQLSRTPLHFAADLFAGARFKWEWYLFKFSAGPGLHTFFMTADRWNYINLGVAATTGFEFAIAPRWTLMIDGFASLDNGNFGTNKLMEPFDISYQYQAAIGVRYSKKKTNEIALFMPKERNAPITIDR